MPDRGSPRVTEVPFLSVVVTARNDDHGGNLLGRMQAFVNGLLVQCERHRVPAELVLVEWNPSQDRAGLGNALDWSARGEYCDVRIIEVPAEVHRRFAHWQALPLYQMIAKNAGIVRARGEFILATNIDILFSDELFRFLAERRLERGKMYRADRWDVMTDVPMDKSLDEQLAWCNSHLLRVNRREGTFPLNPDGSPRIDAYDVVSPERGVTLGANWFPREMSGLPEPFRWVDNDAELLISAPGTCLSLDVEPGPGVDSGPFTLDLRDASGATLASVEIERRTTVTLPFKACSRVFLHTDDGGANIPIDLRKLNFRVFRCEVVEAGPSSAPRRVSANPFARFRRAARMLSAALFSSSEIRIPMSPAALQRLDLREDGLAVSFRLGPLVGGDRGFLSGGLAAIWGDGFYEAERFRDELFRWMQRKGSLTLILPLSCGEKISLLVEAGPAVGFRGAELEIRDEQGKLLSSAKLNGRTKVDVPAGSAKGVLTLALSVCGAESPQAAPGDSRVLALRVLRCELHPPAPAAAAAAIFEARPQSGVWGIFNCRSRGPGVLCWNGAALAVRAANRLSLEAVPEGTAHVSIRDAHGAPVFEGVISAPRKIVIPPQGAYAFLKISTDRPLILAAVERAAPDGTLTRTLLGTVGPAYLHTNSCGDFTLMAREHWFDVRGYAEFDAFSMNIDSVLCWAAHHAGAREEVLSDPIRIFHIEHSTGSGWTPEGERKLTERIVAKGVPWVNFNDVLAWARAMNRFDAPMIFNHENWGLRDEALREIRPVRGCSKGNAAIQ